MATQVVELSGDEARLLKSMQKVIAKEAEHEAQLIATGNAGEKVGRKVGGAADRAAKGTKNATSATQKFGSSVTSQALKAVAAYGTVTKGLEVIVDLNRRVSETNKEAFGSIKGTKSGDRRLLQVAKDAEDFKGLRDQADSFSQKFGLGRDAARGLVFSARSGGFENSAEFIASNEQVVDIDEQARVATKLPALFESSGLTPEQAINATLAGALNSELDFEQISKSLPQAAEGGRIVGASPAELIASQSVLSSLFKSQDTSADRIKLLATKLGLDERTSGKGLIGGVEALQGLPEDERKKFIGDSQEINVAFKSFSDSLGNIKAQIPSIQAAIDTTGTSSSVINQRKAIAASDPKSVAELEARKAELGLEIARENRRGVGEGQRQAAGNKALTTAESQGVSRFRIAAAEAASDSLSGFAGDNVGTEGIALALGDNLANFDRDLSFAVGGGGQSVSSTAVALAGLREARGDDPNALLPKGQVATFAAANTGRATSAEEISDETQIAFTNALVNKANESLGLGRSLAAAIPLFGKLDQAASAGSAEDRSAELVELIRELVADSKQTKTNTKPKRVSQSDVVANARSAG